MNLIAKLKSTKFILAAFVTVVGIVLLCCKQINSDQFVEVLKIIIPAYFVSNTVAGHQSFQAPQIKGSPRE